MLRDDSNHVEDTGLIARSAFSRCEKMNFSPHLWSLDPHLVLLQLMQQQQAGSRNHPCRQAFQRGLLPQTGVQLQQRQMTTWSSGWVPPCWDVLGTHGPLKSSFLLRQLYLPCQSRVPTIVAPGTQSLNVLKKSDQTVG